MKISNDPNYLCPKALSAILLTLSMTVLSLCGGAELSHADAQASITVNPKAKLHTLNTLILGQNVLFAANSLWDSKANDVDLSFRPLVTKIAPGIVRFPGGTASNIYLWEDGLGFHSTREIKPYDSTIVLDGLPKWKAVHRGRIFNSRAGNFGELFNFRSQNGSLLDGVTGIKNPFPAGVLIRPEERPGQPDYFMNNYGIMEHMKFVSSIGSQAILTINYSTGLDKEGQISNRVSLTQKTKRAAAWVAFANGNVQDDRPIGTDGEGNDWQTVAYWAKKRADLGHSTPYRIKYWEAGNEIYDKNIEGGAVQIRTYAQDFLVFAKELKKIDPEIKLGAVGLTSPRGRGDLDSEDEWNATLFKLAGKEIDFVILHSYYPSAGEKPAPYKSKAWYNAVMAGASQAIADLREIKKIIQENSPPSKKVGIAVTEYGIWPSAAKDSQDWSNLARALFDADLLMGLLREGDNLGVNLATNWILTGSMHSALIHFNWSTRTRRLRPQYYALQLLRNLAPQLVDTQVISPTFSVTRVGNVMDASAIPVIGALASLSDDGRDLTLLVLNRSLAAPLPVTIRLLNYPASVVQVFKLASASLGDHNEDKSETVTVTTGQLNKPGSQLNYTLEPHSLTLFKFQYAQE